VAHEAWGAAPPSGCDIESPDFVRLVEAYGGKGAHLASPNATEVDQALDLALGHEGIYLLEVRQNPHLQPCMAKYQAPLPDKRATLRRHMDFRNVHLAELARLVTHIGPSPVEVHQGIRYRPNRALTYAVTYHGHVDFVIKGTVPQPILENPVPAASIRYAFEAATVLPDNMESIGEMLVVKGKAYVKCTDKTRADYYTMLTGNSMVSPAAGIVTPLDASPLLTVELTEDAARGRSFAEVMGSMLQTLQNRPFCAGGRVTFKHLYATAICKATVHGENIFEHKDAYYDPTRAAVCLEDRAGYVFGFVADFRKMKPNVPYNEIRRVLYPGSGGQAGAAGEMAASVHFHVAILRPEYSNVKYDDLDPAMFEDIEHLDCSSTVRSMELEVYTIQEMHPHVPGVSDALPPFSHLEPDGAWETHSVHPSAQV